VTDVTSITLLTRAARALSRGHSRLRMCVIADMSPMAQMPKCVWLAACNMLQAVVQVAAELLMAVAGV
jgi:hypothetical protein